MFMPNEEMVASSLKFDKAGVLDCYLAQKQMAEIFLKHQSIILHNPSAYDPVQRSTALSKLQEIGLRDMKTRLNRSWNGRVLYGKFCADPLKLAVLQTVFEDRKGDAVAVSVTNFGAADASADKFCKDQMVALKQPHLQQNDDGRYSLRVNNPDDVEIVASFPAEAVLGRTSRGSNKSRKGAGQKTAETVNASRTKSGVPSGTTQGTEDPADSLRSQGNACFAKGDMKKAIELYTESIACLEKSAGNEVSSELLLCYSNRAEAWLRLDEFEKAVSDADKALEQDPKHEKSLFRKGKSLHGLQQYDECAGCLRDLLALDTPGVNVQREEIETLISLADKYSMGYMQKFTINLGDLKTQS